MNPRYAYVKETAEDTWDNCLFQLKWVDERYSHYSVPTLYYWSIVF